MSNDYQLIGKRNIINDGFRNLDILLQKSVQYQHHYKNYEESIASDSIPKGLQVEERPAFEPISKDFNIKWNNILRDAEINLAELLT